jgi:diguanylate cyclase (GGDEF)-like protein
MFLPVDIRERVRSAFHEVIGGERPAFVNYESPIVTKDGERRLVLWNNIVLRDTQGGVIGTSSIGEDITERKRAEQELQKLSAELMRVSKKFKKIDLKDPHTGLYNNRYLEEVIDREFSRAQRYASPISLMMLDVDYFKSINDLYGHLFGDLVLKQLAHLLKKLVRRYDIVVRYGGEEFVVISPGTDSQGALLMGQRLFDIIGVYNFGNKKNSVKLKISLAIASYPEDGIGKGIDLIRTAERILDKAKADGGNKIYSSQDTKKEKRAEVSEGARPEGVKYLKDKIDNLTKRANQNLMAAVFAFAKTIELKDHYTGSHVEETVYYSREIARELDLPKVETEQVKQAAILHDLGKIGISERILLKKGKLTKKEFAEIKKHPVIAADIIRPIHFLKEIVPMVLHHHERWDGKGYPTGLKGEEIPIGARIIAIADVYQALTSDRPYRKAFSKKEAVRIIKNGSGTQFDPKVVDVFLKVLKRTNTKKFK